MASTRKKITVAATLIIVASAAAAAYWYQFHYQTKEVLQCQWRKVLGKGEEEGFEIAKSAGLRLEIQGQQNLLSLSAQSGMQQGFEGGYGECSLNWDHQSDTSDLKLNPGKNKFILSSKDEKYEILKLKQGYRLTILKANPLNCGMGADWPRSIELSKDKASCSVKY